MSAGQLAADLAAATANLTGWIEDRAAELAAGLVADAEAIADGRCAALEQTYAAERKRHLDLEAELRHQLERQIGWQANHVRGRCQPADP